MSSGATGLAGRYAGALYALAVESKKIDAIHADLTAFGISPVYPELQNTLTLRGIWKADVIKRMGD